MRTDFNPHSPFRDDADLIIPHKLPPDVPVVCILTHLPDKGEYHAERWEIVKASLTLARQNADTEHHLMIWDNGSAPEFRQWLSDFAPDTLILSHKIGVVNAMRRVYGMFHDSIISWCNDDLVYYPNWLQPQIDILNAYPNATVSGCATRYYMGKADDATLKWAKVNATIEQTETPYEWDVQHGASISKSNIVTVQYSGKKVPLIKYNGVEAFIGGNHCQMTCRPEMLYPLLPRTDMYMLPLFQTLDMALNDKGYLRLLTTERLTRHIGNVMTDEDRKEINELVD